MSIELREALEAAAKRWREDAARAESFGDGTAADAYGRCVAMLEGALAAAPAEAQQPAEEQVAFWIYAARHVATDNPQRATIALLRRDWERFAPSTRESWERLARTLMAAPLPQHAATPQPEIT